MGKFSSSFMYKSPLNGAYTSGAGQGSTYVSNRKAFQQLQSDIVAGAKEGDRLERINKANKEFDKWFANTDNPTPEEVKAKKIALGLLTPKDTKNTEDTPVVMLGKCPKGKVRSKINKKCVSKKGAGKEYDK